MSKPNPTKGNEKQSVKPQKVQETSASEESSAQIVKKKSLIGEDLNGFLILVILYTIQGIVQGYFGGTIRLLFDEQGAHSSDLGTLSFCLLPFGYKFLVAPLMDAYYHKGMGKRKTYIVPVQYLFALLCFVLSFSLTTEIKEKKVFPVLLLGLTSCILMALQDVAVDGWAVTILSKENVTYGPLSQIIGLTFGQILSLNMFIPLNSVSFCNKYIFSIPRDTPLITNENFWLWTGIISCGITFLIQMFKKEKSDPNEETTTISDVILTLKSFATNPNLRQLGLVNFTVGISLAPISALSDTVLLHKGFPKETLTNLGTLMIPVQILTAVVASQFCKKKLENKLRLWAYIALALNCVFLWTFVKAFDMKTNYQETFYFVGISALVMTIAYYTTFLGMTSYTSRICDQSVGGTFLTTFAAIFNMGQILSTSLSFYLYEYFTWEQLGMFSLVTTFFYFIWSRKQLNELHEKTAENFVIKKTKVD